jgi:ribonucleoside-diphosphate reductase alpha chain
VLIDRLGPPPDHPGEWSETALRVLRERYLARDGEGRQETPEEMLWRVARTVAEAESRFGGDVEAQARAFYAIMVDRDFLPNSPTLMNAGRANGLQYSACYVLPIDDSIEGIFDAIKRAAIIHQSGGGTGFSFSRLRARNSRVASTGGRASGPVSFMRVFNAATEAVKQGGTRRGANMGILRVDHSDIEEFIDCKRGGDIANFNISVALTDAFMDALERHGSYTLFDHRGEPAGEKPASEIWRRIVSAAWQTGDPGLVFIDRINRSPANPTPSVASIEATNPCGEQPLAPNEACNLGSVNLSRFVKGGEIDWPRLARVVEVAVRLLDDVIECNPYPLPEIDAMVKANRRIGLGVMGWADLLMALGVPYAEAGALRLAEQVMAFVQKTAREASESLSEARGPFPNFSRSIYSGGRPRRNATVTTIAPTGTISIIAGCSSGIEPAFALAYSHVVGERRLSFLNPVFEAVARERGVDLEAVRRDGVLPSDAPPDLRAVFATAHEIAPEAHVRMQAAFQRHTENGVSKTINLGAAATVEDVDRAYRLAWKEGCLGITVYRDRSKDTQVLYAGSDATPRVAPRPRKAEGATWRVESPLGTCFITVNHDPGGQPLEVFANVGKAGSDIAAVSEAMGRLISLVLRLPSPLPPSERVREVISQLQGIGGARPLGLGRQRVRSLPDAIAQVLAEHVGASPPPSAVGDLCPECGQATLVFEEGCNKCWSCGYSMC